MENGHIASSGDESPSSSQDGEENSPNGKAKSLLAPASISGHKRSLSGNILSFPFFGGSQSRQDVAPKSPIKTKPQAEGLPPSPRASKSAMASVMQQTKPRKRKGSLRKAALLGGKTRLASSSEEQSFGPEQNMQPMTTGDRRDSSPHTRPTTPKAINPIPPQVPSHTKPTFNIQQYHPAPPSGTALHRLEATKPIIHLNDPLPIPSIPPKPSQPSASPTTPDDDLPAPLKKHPLPGSLSDSYFPPLPRARHHQKSPLASLPSSTLPSSPLAGTPPLSSPPQDRPHHQQHDYAETRAWGWALLATTWIVVVVGMGSCLGVWSWAWDVGETPYAPPELEDDPTLPIVGYYPALIILTGVMAWVWVVVAWVGMKYFRHATMGEG